MPTPKQPATGKGRAVNVVKSGRAFQGSGQRAAAPVPFLHLHPANKSAVENFGRAKIGPKVEG